MYNQVVGQFTFDQRKALEVILFISKKIPDLYHILKILYFADRKHLQEYGRFICGDSYVAMNNGPVPSEVYDMIKHVRGDGTIFKSEYDSLMKEFSINGNNIIPLREPNLELLSESDIKCLENSINENQLLTFEQLKSKSHDTAYKSADENDFISVENIAKSLEDGDKLIDYLQNMYK